MSNVSSFIKFTPVTGERACEECFFCGGGVGPFAEEGVCFECYCEVLAKEDPSEHRYIETTSDDMPF